MAGNRGLEWFRPMWRRVAVVAFCVIWCAWEWIWNHDQFWGFLTLGLTAYAIWTFFISFDRNVDGGGDAPKPPSA